MGEIIIPQGYKSALNLHDTQVAIKTVKDYFQHELTHRLHLLRVTAPLFVQPETGLNDNLNGVEHPVSFELKDQGTKKTAEIVQSLAKWKRYALHKYGFSEGEGIYTDMNAIRRDEEVDNLHSIYVDQWDWEKVISAEDRNVEYLKRTVRDIVGAISETSDALNIAFPSLHTKLARDVFFITTQELEDLYPDLTWALVPTSGISKETGRSTPFKLSFRPEFSSTNSGAETRRRLSALLRFTWKLLLMNSMARCISYTDRGVW